ncbi:NAD-dependent epimerase/dehydratase family protein [Lactovum miscens]|uniref:UDP-glucose 4-epimerase n=1 Tax=Lactovum miscens TaxID=190387 RepID=A0A841C8F2_9LACT|nr:NAD-dependent epimerase/dehydratase family protein [Lactovum miscens]MBB5887679.1 UDP-glucose 4-epimerase [Lactovum miscens]
MIKNSKILVTGGAGFIGSSLTNKLLVNNEVIVVDDLSMGNFSNLVESTNLTKIEGSVTDKTLLEEIFIKYNFDYIFHLAAVASVADSVARPFETHLVNFDSTMTILELLRNNNNKTLKRLVFSSSAAVYGDDPILPKSEMSSIKPLTPYAIDKFASERMVSIYNNLYGVPTSATRFFNVYGPKQNPKSPYSGFISILVDCFKKNKKITIFGNGEQSRDFVYIDDVVQALILLATSEQAQGEVYNVGTGKQVTLNELLGIFQDISGKNIEIVYAALREGDIIHSVSDIGKIVNIGFENKFDFKSGLAKYLKYEGLR